MIDITAPFLISPTQAIVVLEGSGVDSATAKLRASAISEMARQHAMNTRLRLAHALAQFMHESMKLKVTVENLNYSAEGMRATWPTRFRGADGVALSKRLHRNPEAVANYVYGGRIGNTAPGDGWLYRGRGLVQLTGKDNYVLYDADYRRRNGANSPSFVKNPELIEQPLYAADAAGYYWTRERLNALADKGDDRADVLAISRAVNLGSATSKGTPAGLEDRIANFVAVMRELRKV